MTCTDSCPCKGAAPSNPADGIDPENQYIGDLMILQVLADSDAVNEQEREVLLRWIELSQPPGVTPSNGRQDAARYRWRAASAPTHGNTDHTGKHTCPLCDAWPDQEHAPACPRHPSDPMGVRRGKK